jgi:hypothetical protein
MALWHPSGPEVISMTKGNIRTTLYLNPVLWKQIKIEAIERGESATALVNLAIRDWLAGQKKGGR